MYRDQYSSTQGWDRGEGLGGAQRGKTGSNGGPEKGLEGHQGYFCNITIVRLEIKIQIQMEKCCYM